MSINVLIASALLPGSHTDGLNLILREVLKYIPEDINVTVFGADNGYWDIPKVRIIRLQEPKKLIVPIDRIKNLISPLPAEYRRFYTEDFIRTFDSLKDGADVIWLFSSHMLPFINLTSSGVPIVLSLIDEPRIIEKQNFKAGGITSKIRSLVRLYKLEKTFSKYLPQVSALTFATKEDMVYVSRLQNKSKSPSLHVIHNGVELDLFRPSTKLAEKNIVAFSGVMNYRPNIDAACIIIDKIAPIVVKKIPNIQFKLIGRNPAKTIIESAMRFNQRFGQNYIIVTGKVSDMPSELKTSKVFICPMVNGTGIKNKLLEAMACGLPCLATSLATQGINTKEKISPIKVSEKPIILADYLIEYLMDYQKAKFDGIANRAFIEKHFQWCKTAEQYFSLIRDLAKNPLEN
jgi:polysaccharide biosynthesis protein PslH